MLTLYGARGSGSAAIEIALGALGLPWRSVEGATWDPGPGFDELATVNPLKQIPALRLDDGSVLTESAAILIHLGLAHPQSALLPAEPSARAQAIRGLVYIVANCYAAIGVIDYPERWCEDADEPTRQRIIRGTKARLHGLWEVFADQHPARPFLGGDRAGALDYLAVIVSRWGGTRAHLKKTRPALHEALQRIEALPEVAPVIARHWPPG